MDEARLREIETRAAAATYETSWRDYGYIVDEDVPALIAEVRRLREQLAPKPIETWDAHLPKPEKSKQGHPDLPPTWGQIRMPPRDFFVTGAVMREAQASVALDHNELMQTLSAQDDIEAEEVREELLREGL